MAKKTTAKPKTTKTTTKKRKPKEVKEVKEYVFYTHKSQAPLFVADKFVYEMTVYELDKNTIGLFDSKQTEVSEFKGYTTCQVVEKNKKRFQQIIELIGAPIDFLETNRFNLK